MSDHFPLTMEQLEFYLERKQPEKMLEAFGQCVERYQLQQARLETLLDTVNEAVGRKRETYDF